MAERLKDIFFTEASLDTFADAIQKYYPRFDRKKFHQLVNDAEWKKRELKAKMRHVSQCLHETLPGSYKTTLGILQKAAPHVKGFEAMSLPDYVELYGLDDWASSLPALAVFTRYASAEFAIRPFIARDPEKAMKTVLTWAGDKNEHVRRLASEGCRPRLPWGMALQVFKKDPSLILPVLEKLKNDSSDFVRRSVANNLNDISKDHPDVVLDVCERWNGKSRRTDSIVKHACRGMLKAGNKRAMALFGYADPKKLRVKKLELDRKTVAIGEDLQYHFDVEVKAPQECEVRLEIAVYYVRPRGKHSKKIYKIREGKFKPGVHTIARKLSFKDQSTRKHHPGTHEFSILVNGIEKASASVRLSRPRR
jgi:3-methyladenine DNA glycosylase AlkC